MAPLLVLAALFLAPYAHSSTQQTLQPHSISGNADRAEEMGEKNSFSAVVAANGSSLLETGAGTGVGMVRAYCE
eukprot:493403-Amorphochlora_amoeboformis.AAC.1